MEFLKNIFGDKALTYADFTAAIEADKNIKLVNLKKALKLQQKVLIPKRQAQFFPLTQITLTQNGNISKAKFRKKRF